VCNKRVQVIKLNKIKLPNIKIFRDHRVLKNTTDKLKVIWNAFLNHKTWLQKATLCLSNRNCLRFMKKNIACIQEKHAQVISRMYTWFLGKALEERVPRIGERERNGLTFFQEGMERERLKDKGTEKERFVLFPLLLSEYSQKNMI